MLPASGPLLRVVHADQESPQARVARIFAAECAAAALEVFERQRPRGPHPRTAIVGRVEGGTLAGMFLLLGDSSRPER